MTLIPWVSRLPGFLHVHTSLPRNRQNQLIVIGCALGYSCRYTQDECDRREPLDLLFRKFLMEHNADDDANGVGANRLVSTVLYIRVSGNILFNSEYPTTDYCIHDIFLSSVLFLNTFSNYVQ